MKREGRASRWIPILPCYTNLHFKHRLISKDCCQNRIPHRPYSFGVHSTAALPQGAQGSASPILYKTRSANAFVSSFLFSLHPFDHHLLLESRSLSNFHFFFFPFFATHNVLFHARRCPFCLRNGHRYAHKFPPGPTFSDVQPQF